MTPEERARAEEITTAMERFAKDRQPAPAVTIPGISRNGPTPSENALKYGAVFCVLVATHIAAYFAYAHHMATREQEIRQEASTELSEAIRREFAAELKNETIEKERAYAETSRLLTMLSAAQQAATLAESRAGSAIKQKPSPKIEYNTYSEQKPTIRPQYQPQPEPAQPAPKSQSEVFSRDDHAKFAVERAKFYFNGEFAKKIGVSTTWVTGITVDSTTYDENWGKYITEGKVNLEYYQTKARKSYSRSEKYEVVTHVRNGQIALETDVVAK